MPATNSVKECLSKVGALVPTPMASWDQFEKDEVERRCALGHPAWAIAEDMKWKRKLDRFWSMIAKLNFKPTKSQLKEAIEKIRSGRTTTMAVEDIKQEAKQALAKLAGGAAKPP